MKNCSVSRQYVSQPGGQNSRDYIQNVSIGVLEVTQRKYRLKTKYTPHSNCRGRRVSFMKHNFKETPIKAKQSKAHKHDRCPRNGRMPSSATAEKAQSLGSMHSCIQHILDKTT